MIRVLVVDDQELVRLGLRHILEATDDIRVVGEAKDGLAALDAAERLRPDVVLMDIRMPRMDGVEATRLMDGPRVVMLTTFDHDEYVVEALRAGASGFVVKDAPADELLRAIRVVAGGDALLSPSVTRRMLARVISAMQPKPGARSAQIDELTEREREVLVLVAQGNSNVEIAGTLHVSEATVKTHVSHLLDKLGLRDRVQAVVLAYESGLVTPRPD
ncbi:MAG: response regulator transcription factor [Candidatus Dormibacteraeota bacterium]|nr:response regulator transcription factor [Candidatus Dormibacteraeota bacterium]